MLKLAKADFVELLGSLRDELVKRAPKDNQRRGSLSAAAGESPVGARPPTGSPGGGSSAGPSTGPSPMGARAGPTGGNGGGDGTRATTPPASQLCLLKQLGSGGYGRVSLVRDKRSKRVYALKRVCKAHLLAHNGMMRCEWLLREKRVLETLEHPFIVSTRRDLKAALAACGCSHG